MKNALIVIMFVAFATICDSHLSNERCKKEKDDLRSTLCNNLKNFITKLKSQKIPKDTSLKEVIQKFVEHRKNTLMARLQQFDRLIPSYNYPTRFRRQIDASKELESNEIYPLFQ